MARSFNDDADGVEDAGMKFPNLADTVRQINEAVSEFVRRVTEALKPLVEAMYKFFEPIFTMLKFRVLSAWYFYQTHHLLDERYIPSPISKALSEIFYPHAPPDFLSVN